MFENLFVNMVDGMHIQGKDSVLIFNLFDRDTGWNFHLLRSISAELITEKSNMDPEGGSSTSTESATNSAEDRGSDSEMLPYANWASEVAASSQQAAPDPLPENVIRVMGQVFQNDMVCSMVAVCLTSVLYTFCVLNMNGHW